MAGTPIFEVFGRVLVDNEEANKSLSKTDEKASGVGKALSTVGKAAGAMGAAVGAGAVACLSGIASLTKASAEAYADYEQLKGGVETLFKDSADQIVAYSEQAYKTTGLSASEYMETVTGFSASLIASLGGDTEKAAKAADQALVDMSDNANKMGTDMESIQNAYQGFAKGQFTMLDNLKLGYGGTATEMQRLLDDATKISGVEYDISSFADITEAIHVVQTEMGIAGTTSKEAMSTISGSVNMTKSAWENLVTGLADENADLATLTDNLVESALAVVDNVGPIVTRVVEAIPTALSGIISAIEKYDLIGTIITMAASLVDALTQTLPTLLTQLINAVVTILPGLLSTLLDLLPALIETVVILFTGLVEALPDMLTMILDSLITLIPQLISGIVEMFMVLISHLPEIILPIIEAIPDIIVALIDAIISNVPTLIVGLITLCVELVKATPQIIIELVKAIPQIFKGIWDAIVKMVPTLWEQLKGLFTDLAQKAPEWLKTTWEAVKKFAVDTWEKAKKRFEAVKDFFKNLAEGVANVFKKPVNWIIGKLNDFLEGINGIKIPDWVPLVGGKGFNIPLIPELASGGVLEKGQTGFLEGNGAEAVVPLENNKKWISAVAEDMGTIGGGEVIGLLKDILEAVKDGGSIYLDGKTLVGGIANDMDKKLGSIYAKKVRA